MFLRFTCSYFTTYEAVKAALRDKSQHFSTQNACAIAAGGGCAGMVYTLVHLPADNVQDKFRTGAKGTFSSLSDTLHKTIGKEGVASLFRNCGRRLLVAFPSDAACFMGFELALRYMRQTYPDMV